LSTTSRTASGARPSELIEEQDFRPAHERASDGEHLLLATGQGAGQLLATLAENRE